MQQLPKKYKILAVIGFFLLALAFGTNTILKRLAPPPGDSKATLPAPNANGASPQNPLEGSATGSPVPVDSRPVRYSETGFEPTTLTVKSSDALGCLITIINASKTSLQVGVSPHRESGDPGSHYKAIKPGESIILDPRYPGLNNIHLHSHDRPEHKFRVEYGQGCQ